MTQQHISLGTAPAGVDGDTVRVAMGKAEANFNELYAAGGASPTISFKNKFINGNFDFWQRGTNLAASASVGYLADRWRINAGGSTRAPSQQAFALGQTAVPNEPAYFHRIVVASVANANNYVSFQQFVESVRTFAGQQCTISFWAKADAAKSIAIEFVQDFGSGGSFSAAVNSIGVTTINLTTAWQKFSVTVLVPSIAGKTIGTDLYSDSLRISFWLDAGATYNGRTNSLGQQSGTFDFAQMQLEAGSVATNFEMRPPQKELALCQRYYEKTYVLNVNPGTATNTGRTLIGFGSVIGTLSWFSVAYKVTKRTAAGITVYDSSGTPNMVGQDSGASVSATISDSAPANFAIQWTNGSGRWLGVFHWTADAEF